MAEQLKQLIFPTCNNSSNCSPVFLSLEIATTEQSCTQNTCGWQPCHGNGGQICTPNRASLTNTEKCQDYYLEVTSTDEFGLKTVSRKKIVSGQCIDECQECEGTSVYTNTFKGEWKDYYENGDPWHDLTYNQILTYTTTNKPGVVDAFGGCYCVKEYELTSAQGSLNGYGGGGYVNHNYKIIGIEPGDGSFHNPGNPIWENSYTYKDENGDQQTVTFETIGGNAFIWLAGGTTTETYDPPLQTPTNVYKNLNTNVDCSNHVYPNTTSFLDCGQTGPNFYELLTSGQTLTNNCWSPNGAGELRRAYHFVSNPKNNNARDIRSLKYRVVHSKPETCYLKVWLIKIIEEFTFNNNIGCGRWSTTPNIVYAEPLGTYEWSEDYPCTGVYNNCNNPSITTIYGPTSSLITPSNGQKVRVCISKYSLVKDYVPDDPWATPYCKPNGLPSPCCCEDTRAINQNDPVSLYCSIC